ncbi:hypothetical protein cypCar_00033033 [Cyprinus carpio]|nr:hypothetical protein cypCar_00033033 [Cyprinus carpio]
MSKQFVIRNAVMCSVVILKKMVHVVVLIHLCLWHLVGVFADLDAEESVSVLEGDSVTLNSGLTKMMDDDLILWRFGYNKILIAKINVMASSITVYDDVLDGRFRDRLKVDHQTGSLIITNTRTEHTGLYQLQSNSVRKSFNLTVYAVTEQSPSYPSDSVSLIVLVSAAVAGSLLMVAAVRIFCICRKHKKTYQQASECYRG